LKKLNIEYHIIELLNIVLLNIVLLNIVLLNIVLLNIMTYEYIYYHEHIIEIDGNVIINIIDKHNDKSRDRLALKGKKFIVNKTLPEQIKNNKFIYKYKSIDILKNANNLVKPNRENGVQRYYNINGNITKEYYCNNFKKEGMYKEYFWNGSINIECYYVNDYLHGTYKEYEYENIQKSDEDRLVKICNYNMNKLCGKYIKYHYYPNKKYYEEYTYIDNIKNGEYKILSPNHTVLGKYENGIIINKITIQNENIMYKENKINDNNNLINIYIDNKLFETYEKNTSNNKKYGNYKKYFDGNIDKINIECNYFDDKIHGIYREYFNDGKIKIECEYDIGIEKNKKIYNADGKLIEYCVKGSNKNLLYYKLETENNTIYDEFIRVLNKN
jgi:antitoxin component YwqK of YwqJK toxin-antitoxin module